MVDTFKSTLEIHQAIDEIYRERGFGERGATYRDMLFGNSTMGYGNFVAGNKDHKGFVFFTRPILNLTYSNLSKVRRLVPFRDATEYSLLRHIRVLLDPWSQNATKDIVYQTKEQDGWMQPDTYTAKTTGSGANYVDCPTVDPKNPFMPLLQNTLLSLSGWPDPVVDYYTSPKGLMGEEHIMADGVYDRYGSFSLEATFRNTDGNPLILLFDLWETYMMSVKINDMQPYDDMIECREIDYMTRIYRFVLDPSKRYISLWAACGAGFPVNNPMNSVYAYDNERTFSDGSQSLSYSFQCVGAMYNDAILFDEFNRLVSIYNPDLRIIGHTGTNNKDNQIVGAERWIKILPHEHQRFNFNAYPLINEYTQELEWWVKKDIYIKLGGEQNVQ